LRRRPSTNAQPSHPSPLYNLTGALPRHGRRKFHNLPRIFIPPRGWYTRRRHRGDSLLLWLFWAAALVLLLGYVLK